MFIYDEVGVGEKTQIGFNIGDGFSFYMLPNASSKQFLDINQLTNTGIPGLLVYCIDGKQIV